MTVGIFGGSFNPVHNGHIALAKALVSRGIVDEVWLTLSPLNPLKSESSELIDDAHRLAMLELATAGCQQLKVCDIELSLPRPSYTINTLNALAQAHPKMEFRLIIGADNRLIFDKWRSHEEIERRFKPIVYPRPGYPCSEALEMDIYDVSSTEIRRRLHAGEGLSELVPEKVADYIGQHQLYL